MRAVIEAILLAIYGIAGVARGTLVFLLPGSTNACRLAVERILLPQLDARTRPCNFARLLDRL